MDDRSDKASPPAPGGNGNSNIEASLPLLVSKTDPSVPAAGGSTFLPALKKIRFVPLFMLVAATIGVVAVYFQPPGIKLIMRVLQLEPGGGTSSPIAVPAKPATSDLSTAAEQDQSEPVVMGLGKLLPDGDVRTIAPPFGAGDASVEVMHVSEGDQVKAGDILASLDNASNLANAVQSAESTVAAREASLEQIRQSVLSSQTEARASLRSAQSALQVAQADYDRNQSLVERGFISGSVLDQKRASRDQARDTVQKLRATLARFEARSIDEQPDVLVAARNVDAARSELNRARSDLSRSQVKAPIDGSVLKIYVRPGERPGNTGVMDIGNTAHMTAEVEVFQTAIGSVRIGAPVTLTAKALTKPLKGTVSRIGLEVGSQTLVDASPAARTDARVVRVRVELDPASSDAATRLTNLQVLARIAVVKP
ncbi:MAG: HlyD family efflux transporter periplasmic adaptor subunit [Burkholderiaceae bacterium]